MVATPRYELTMFKVCFENLTLKAYTNRAHVLRCEAIVHNTKELGCGRVIDRYCKIAAALRTLLERFLTVPDCVDAAFVADETPDQLPVGCQVGNTRVGGVDLNKPRTRAVLQAMLALSPLPAGFTAAQVAAKVQAITGRAYTARQAAYDLQELRGKDLAVKLDGTPALPHPTTGHPHEHRTGRPA